MLKRVIALSSLTCMLAWVVGIGAGNRRPVEITAIPGVTPIRVSEPITHADLIPESALLDHLGPDQGQGAIRRTATGAVLGCDMQDLEGVVTSQGLTVRSIGDGDPAPVRFKPRLGGGALP